MIFIILPFALIEGKYSSFILGILPFGIGLVFALLASFFDSLKLSRIMLLSLLPIGFSILSCIVIAGEGALCFIIMGLLLLVPFYIGIVIGYHIQKRIWLKNGSLVITFFIIFSSFNTIPNYSKEKIVQDEIVIHMSKEKLWTKLMDDVSFGISDNFFFKNGVSYPNSMKLETDGNQKYLLCKYNNGVIKAPVIDFKDNEYFAFKFNDSLISMREKNFYNESHTMHLQNHFEIRYGKFEIIGIDGTKCKLIASTCYMHRFKPEFYTNIWVDYFVHKLHVHVLSSIKKQNEL